MFKVLNHLINISNKKNIDTCIKLKDVIANVNFLHSTGLITKQHDSYFQLLVFVKLLKNFLNLNKNITEKDFMLLLYLSVFFLSKTLEILNIKRVDITPTKPYITKKTIIQLTKHTLNNKKATRRLDFML